jgi:cell division septation protein DedD
MISGNDGALKGRLIAIVILTVVSGGSFTLGYFVGRAGAPEESRELVVRNLEATTLAMPEEQNPEGFPEEVVKEPPMLKPAVEAAPEQTPEESRELKVKKRALKKQTRGTYSVQAGVFKEKSYAESFTLKLKKRGYGAFVESSGDVYVVKVGTFESRDEADALAHKLKEAEGIDGFVTLSPG